ncbi:hypothetical protein MVES1_001717 [Malassezia vespertilionis]|nr:uncharacterized protein MVES1_001717 [Malassezia vespertilionis]WFD06372.1 hypothetical protein MVES1_001717 [Malassezia vespertilionis]
MTDTPALAHGVQSLQVSDSKQPVWADPNEKLMRLFGPNVGDHFEEHTRTFPDTSHITTADLSQWIQRDRKAKSVSSLDLYVNMHKSTVKLLPEEQVQGARVLDKETSNSLSLISASHAITFDCDCVAPRARIELYVLNSRMVHGMAHAPPPAQPQPQPQPQPPGWRIASLEVQQGVAQHAALPLLLDEAWNFSEEAPLELALYMEALDEDGERLGQPNALTMRLAALYTSDADPAWRIQVLRRNIYIGGYDLLLQDLFGIGTYMEKSTNETNLGEPEKGGMQLPQLSLDTEDEKKRPECPICMTLAPNTILLPCTHALCRKCAERVIESVQKSRIHEMNLGRAPRMRYACPICRGEIQTMLALAR